MGTVCAEVSSWRDLTRQSRDEDNILDQIHEKQLCRDFYNEDFNAL